MNTTNTQRVRPTRAAGSRWLGGLVLVPSLAPMQYADTATRHGDVVRFTDKTGHIHGEYQIGNPFSPAPANAIGAAKLNGAWYWITQNAPGERRRADDVGSD